LNGLGFGRKKKKDGVRRKRGGRSGNVRKEGKPIFVQAACGEQVATIVVACRARNRDSNRGRGGNEGGGGGEHVRNTVPARNLHQNCPSDRFRRLTGVIVKGHKGASGEEKLGVRAAKWICALRRKDNGRER